MNCDPQVREHLHKAHESASKAAHTAADELRQRFISDEVRVHLRSAARSVLHAGMAMLDADEARRAARKHATAHPASPCAATASSVTAPAPETPPATA